MSLASLSGSADIAALFDDAATLAAMARFEVALAHASADHGVISGPAAAAIARVAGAWRPDADALAAQARTAGPLAIPFVRALRQAVAAHDQAAADALHLGATSQDVLDTAMMLQVRDAAARVVADGTLLTEAIADLAERHVGTLMAGRTLLQAAQPVPFGLRAAQWAAQIADGLRAVEAESERACVLQLGGAAGTLAGLGPAAPAVAEAMARQLGLGWDGAPWHARRDAPAALGCAVGLLAGGCGKVARDLILMMQTGVGEAFEAGGGSSAMPHKHNPVACVAAAAHAARAPGLVAGLLAGITANEWERGAGGWQAERPTIQALLELAHAAVMELRAAFAGLRVDSARMAANLDALHGADGSELALLALTPSLGRTDAETRVSDALARAGDTRGGFFAALREQAPPDARAELDRLSDPSARLGSAELFARRLIARARHGASDGEEQTRFLRRDGMALHLRLSAHPGRPRLVLLHALGTDLSLWDGVCGALAGRCETLRLDLRGHGLSDAAGAAFTIEDLADDVTAALDLAGWTDAVVCGVSVGGLVAQAMAARHAERLRGVVLCCTAARIGEPAAWDSRIALVRGQGLAAAGPALVARWFAPAWLDAHPDEADAASRRLARMDADGYVAMCAAIGRADMSRHLTRIRVPALCLAGADDVAVPTERVAALCEAIPGATLSVLGGVGHLPPLEDPAGLAARLRGFARACYGPGF